MRLSLFVLGIIAATVCVEKPAEAQNGTWCLYQDGDGDGSPQCRYATLQQCLADRLGGSSCGPSPYPSSPQSPADKAPKALTIKVFVIAPATSDIRGDPPRLGVDLF